MHINTQSNQNRLSPPGKNKHYKGQNSTYTFGPQKSEYSAALNAKKKTTKKRPLSWLLDRNHLPSQNK